MAKKTDKKELISKEDTRQDFFSSFGDVEHYFDRFFRHPFSMMMHPSLGFRDFPQFEGFYPRSIFLKKGGYGR